MSKARSAALRRDIERLAAVIHQKHLRLEEAEKKELAFIHKHLRKAAKEMVRIAARLKTVPARKKAAPAPRKGTKPPPRTVKKAPAGARPPLDPQAQS
jgi:hypothetical protein